MIPPTIPENHKTVLRSAASKNGISENELVRLYQAAIDSHTVGSTKEGNLAVARFMHHVDPPVVPGHRVQMTTVTNISGVFVKLTQELQKAAGPLLLSTGKLFSMEGVDPVSSTITTRMF